MRRWGGLVALAVVFLVLGGNGRPIRGLILAGVPHFLVAGGGVGESRRRLGTQWTLQS